MQARDGPESMPNSPHNMRLNYQASAPKTERKSSPKKATAKSSKPKANAQTDTGIKKTRKPRSSKAKKPPQLSGYTWRRDGSGFELRKAVYDISDTGIKKRRLPYVAHLSKSAFAEMKKWHRGVALERAIAQWIAEHDR